jgi:Holliday junction resolvase RusA-like endonuclease
MNAKDASYFIECEPVGKARPRLGRGGVVFTPSKTRKTEAIIGRYLMTRRPEKITAEMLSELELSVKLEFIFSRPKSVKRNNHIITPDIDNICKLVCDACNGILWHDDCLITQLQASKRYAKQDEIPGIRISLYLV